MGFKLVIQYIASHYVLISGTTLALFFTTSMILLIRSIGDKSERSAGGSGSDLDVKAIEGAMKRVLASQPVSIAAGSVLPAPVPGIVDGEITESAASADGGQAEAMRAALREREATIEALRSELQQAKETILAMSEKGAGGGAFAASAGGADSDEELRAFKGKIDELQARLAEYEIIEDDIADLSMYKDENARLKDELERLKQQGASVAASAAVATPAPVPEMKFEKVDRFELDPNDDVMKEFAAAVDVQRAPPPTSENEVPAPKVSSAEAASFASAIDPQAAIDALLMGDAAPAKATSSSPASEAPAVGTDSRTVAADQDSIDALLMGDSAVESDLLSGTPDPEKLLSEVESIQVEDAAATTPPLDDSLDTDKLLAEVDSLASAPADVDDVFSEFNKKVAGG